MDEESKLLRELRESVCLITVKLKDMQADIKAIKKHSLTDEGDYLLEFPEVCQMLCLSGRQVRRYGENGELPGFLLGRRRVYWHSKVLEFIRMKEAESQKKQSEKNKTIISYDRED